jgi:hypothetical protein
VASCHTESGFVCDQPALQLKRTRLVKIDLVNFSCLSGNSIDEIEAEGFTQRRKEGKDARAFDKSSYYFFAFLRETFVFDHYFFIPSQHILNMPSISFLVNGFWL